ncbi:hypothetical protein ERX46_02945 [Brumimicrobium glaciale]|uniref:T9SS C-terminal target domain-containing protein n=1 Tax=Brumimicrobium glaciale TaxID=200475 RepID=A0A4Q4KTB3_9FLAO|nr:hypothetical protein [Brumimicrobium glaciale]RYM35969.1 hypothetical protein ERX46_02945 [Brumimicrobium glaciale]
MKIRKLKVGGLMVIATLTFATASCKKEGCTDETAINFSEKAKKDDGSCKYEEVVSDGSTVMVSQNVTKNTTWTNDKVYVLNTRVTVVSGATLTIEAGTIIKGEVGTGPNATALIIARGGKLMAIGTSTSPIIFTTIADEIKPGQIDSPNMSAGLDGLWGGVIVLGNAPISADNPSVQIEGIPPSDQNGLYGGSDATDNSGILKYISIRHGGANIGEGNEINGLTLGGVGNGTIIENIEVVSNQDDGVEWFGGSVNVRNVIVWNAGDDALDTDQSWSGTLDNFIVIAGESTDHALEIDGPEGSFLAAHTLKNGSIKGAANSELGDFRDGARGTFENIYFFGFPNPATDGRGDLSLSGQPSMDNFASGMLNFSNIQVTLPSGVMLTDVFKNGTDVHATNVSEGANTVGADVTPFLGWTLSDKRGELTNF